MIAALLLLLHLLPSCEAARTTVISHGEAGLGQDVWTITIHVEQQGDAKGDCEALRGTACVKLGGKVRAEAKLCSRLRSNSSSDDGSGAWLVLTLTTYTPAGELSQAVMLKHEGKGRYVSQLRTLNTGASTLRLFAVGNRHFNRWAEHEWTGNRSFFAFRIAHRSGGEETRRCIVSKKSPFAAACNIAHAWPLIGNREMWCDLSGLGRSAAAEFCNSSSYQALNSLAQSHCESEAILSRLSPFFLMTASWL